MDFIYYAIIFVAGLWVYYKRPRWFFFYWMLTYPILMPVLCMLSGNKSIESTFSFVYKYPLSFMYLNIWVLIDTIIIKGRNGAKIGNALLMLSILVIYFVIDSIVTKAGFTFAYSYIKGAVMSSMPIIILALNKSTRPLPKELNHMLFFLIIVESLAAILNIAGVRFYTATYQGHASQQSLMTGTYPSSQPFGNLIAILYLYICFEYFVKKTIEFKSFLTISVLSFFCIISSGSRMDFTIAVVSLILTIVLYKKKHILLYPSLLIVGYLGFSFLMSYSGNYGNTNGGVDRILLGLSSFTQARTAGEEDNSTLSLSEMLLETHFSKSPFWGNGLSTGEDEDSYSIDSNKSSMEVLKADARFAFLLIDIGIFGIFLFLIYFYSLYRVLIYYSPPNDRKAIYIAYIIYLLFSFTEQGFWDIHIFPYVFIYFFAFADNKNLTLIRQRKLERNRLFNV